MISVCMAVKNGARFLGPQLESILPQLSIEDEIIISDDHSSDNTLHLVSHFSDCRIKLLKNRKNGLVSNFENALNACSGQIIFLADQDDIWVSDKIKKTLPLFTNYNLIVSDCTVVDERLAVLHESFFEFNSSRNGVIKNLFRNSYMGCCMAFDKSLLKMALPFPMGLVVHDQWLGLVAERHGRVAFYPEKLVYHRRHNGNASTTFSKSRYNVIDKFSNRLNLAINLIGTRYEY